MLLGNIVGGRVGLGAATLTLNEGNSFVGCPSILHTIHRAYALLAFA